MSRLAIGACAMVLLAACGPGDDRPDDSARPSTTATLRVVEPEAGATVPGPDVRIRVELSGARIVEETTTNLKPDEGHIHVKVDGELVTMTFGTEQALSMKPGTHVVEAEFVAGDHAPFNPRVITQTTFTVQ